VSRPACQAARKTGAPCRAPALPGEPWCWCHHPARQQVAAAARADGGRKAGRLRKLEGKRRRLDSPRAVVTFVSGLVYDVAEGRLDGELGRTLGYLLGVQLRAVELAQRSEIEARLAEVERLLAQRRIG
jgi:hypothetical protein